MPPQSSTKLMGLWGRVYLGMRAREVGEGVSLDEGRRGFGFPGGRVVGEISAGQTREGLVGRVEGEVVGGPLLVRIFGKNIICSADMWQVLRRAGARIRLMRSIHTNWCLPASFEMRTNSTGHLAGGRELCHRLVVYELGQLACAQVGVAPYRCGVPRGILPDG